MFTIVFVAALLVSVALRLWLATRQIRHVATHRNAVPEQFNTAISIEAHQKAAAYTIARTQLGLVEMIASMVFLVALTLLGGLQGIDNLQNRLFNGYNVPILVREVSVILAVVLISSLLDLPLTIYRQFILEARFGFNNMTWRLFAADMIKGTLLAAVLGLPLLAATLWLMDRAGRLWWLDAWILWVLFTLLMQVIAPTLIAPIFNQFKPLEDVALRERIENLLKRCGFASKGVFIMDGSRRSAHGNAYFTGFGATKRIVFFDTLIVRLSPQEIEAVLAHELGHFKLRHVLKRIVGSFAMTLIFLALLGWLAQQNWFYTGLGTEPSVATHNAIALVLFFFVLPVFTFVLAPIWSILSRKHEYEADAFAAAQTNAGELITALVKLYNDNASTLTPDPLHSAFYDSHPPASLRVLRLTQLIAANPL